jgi:hypothetical protein
MTRRAGFAILAVLAFGLALPASTLAAGPPTLVSHIRIQYDEAATICGMSLDTHFQAAGVHIEFSDGESVQNGSFSIQYTDPATGRYAVETGAGTRVFGAAVIDEAAGTISYTTSDKGLLDKLRGSNGTGVLIRNAGLISYTFVYDLATHTLIREDIVVDGPHPGNLQFCDQLNAALA